jgi:hypothetical protein
MKSGTAASERIAPNKRIDRFKGAVRVALVRAITGLFIKLFSPS